MKKIYLLSTIALAGGLTSCYDLSTEPMGGIITEEQRSEIIEADPAAVDGLSAGVYANYNGFEFCVGEMYDFGYPAMMVQLDCRTADYFSINVDLYGWFSSCAKYTDNTNTSGYGYIRWRLPYNTIYSANQVLGTIDKETTDELSKYYLAQAYGNRAFSYWVLAQLFQFNYAGHQNDPCVPILTEENQSEAANEGIGRSTVQEVYDQILSDITTAIELCENNSQAVRADKRYIDASVLYGLRARTYLCMQEYDKAAADAQTAINISGCTPLSANEAMLPGFNDYTAKNWLWGIYYATEDVYGLYTLPGFVSSYSYGYASVGMWKAINSDLFAQISDNDPRKLWWIAPGTRASNAQYYTDASENAVNYLNGAGAPEYAVTKFAPYQNVLGQSNNEADIPLMRIEEMYLILAEAQGLGSAGLAQGKATLENFVNSYRWNGSPAYTCDASSASAFIDEVWFQRRVEFWGEGMGYYDIMRLNKPVDRKNSNWEDPKYVMTSYAYYIPAGDPIFLTQIPESEIKNNKMLTDADQNPVGTVSL